MAPERRNCPACQYPSFAASAMTSVPASFGCFSICVARRDQATLTLVVDTEVNTALVITILNSGETSGGDAFDLQLADLSLEPAFTRSEAVLLENVAGVEVVQTNLSACSVRPWTGIMEPTYLITAVVGDGGKRGACGRFDGEGIVGPHAVQVPALADVAALQLVEDSK